MNRRRIIISVLVVLALAAVGISVFSFLPPPAVQPVVFNGDRAYADVKYQVSLGPRIPGTPAHDQIVQWITAELKKYSWQVQLQQTSLENHPIQNIIAKKGTAGSKPWVIIGAHYDTRMFADQDPDLSKRTQPVPGANDGASGVAVLLELARNLDSLKSKEVWLVFFDTEDQGNIPGWNWILGSQAFVNSLSGKPDYSVVIDMIGDKDLNIYRELNSNQALTDRIWSVAASLGYQDQFINQGKYRMEDDHTPFLEKGLDAIDIIDFDYPWWHTASDTPDKVAPASLKAVGNTLLSWVLAP
jgi:glutaminyl-peptide cyclotransferase